jgi:hypothetical protein
MLSSSLWAPLLVAALPHLPILSTRGVEEAPGLSWGTVLSVSNNGDSVARGVTMGPDDSIIVTGLFEGTLDLGGEELKKVGIFHNMLVVKYDEMGKVVWARQACSRANGGYNEGTDVAVDAEGNVFVCGEFSDQIHFGSGISLASPEDIYERTFLVKYSPDGKPLWARDGKGIETGTGKEVNPESVVVDSNGDAYLCVQFYDEAFFDGHKLPTIGFGNGELDSGLVKYDGRTGEVEWLISACSSGTDRPYSADVDNEGNVFLIYQSSGFTNLGPVRIPPESTPHEAIVIVKLSPEGEFIWSTRGIGFLQDQHTGWGATCPDGGLAVCGRISPAGGVTEIEIQGKILTLGDSADSCVFKLDAEGNLKWVRVFGGSSAERGRGLAVDRNGDVIVTGWMEGGGRYGNTPLHSRGGRDAYLVKLGGNNGQFLWATPVGGPGIDNGTALAIDRRGNPVLAGSCQAGMISAGGEQLQAENPTSFMLLRFGPPLIRDAGK